MINNALSKSWANAIFEIYNENNKIKELESECLDLLLLFDQNENFIYLIGSLHLNSEQKKNIIKEAFFNHISNDLYNAINLMIDKNVASLITWIIKNVINLIDTLNNTKHGIVYSIIQLDKQQLITLEEKVSDKLKVKVKLINRIDKKILGGIKISVDNLVIDYSLANQLKEISNNINITL